MEITTDIENRLKQIIRDELTSFFAKQPVPIPEYLTVKDVARYLSVSQSTVNKWMNESKIAYVKLPGKGVRFKKEWVEGWMNKRTVKALFSYKQY